MSKLQDNRDKLNGIIDSVKTLNENQEKIEQITDRISSPFNKLNESKENFLDTLIDTQTQLLGSDTNEIFKFIRKIIRKTFGDSSKIIKILIEELIGVVNCNADLILTGDVTIKRKEIDIYDILNLDPTDLPGRIVYEKETSDGKRPFNRTIQSAFVDPGSPKSFNSLNGSKLFDLTYNINTDDFTLTYNNISVSDFLSGYYASIRLFDGKNLISEILETMFATYSNLFTTEHLSAKIYLNRIFSILSRICGAGPYTNEETLEEGVNNIGSNENDNDNFFRLDAEDRRFIENEMNLKVNGLFELTDCNNYQVKINQDFIEESILDLEYDDFNEEEIIEQLFSDLTNNIVNEQDPDILINFGINYPSVNMSIIRKFITELPNAIMSKVVSMKAVLPYVAINRTVNNDNENEAQSASDFVFKHEKYIQRVGGKVFRLFTREMIREIKKLLSRLIQDILKEIIKQKLRSRLFMAAALAAAIRALINIDVVTCASIIGELIEQLGLKSRIPTQIPLPLLYGAYSREGANSTRAHLNTIQELRKIGYNLNDLPDGSPNKHVAAMKKTVEGTFKEIAENGSIEFVSKPATVVSPIGGVVPFITGKGVIITSF